MGQNDVQTRMRSSILSADVEMDQEQVRMAMQQGVKDGLVSEVPSELVGKIIEVPTFSEEEGGSPKQGTGCESKEGVSPKQEAQKAPDPEITHKGLKQESVPDKETLELANQLKLLTQSADSQSQPPLVQAMLIQQLLSQKKEDQAEEPKKMIE